MPDPVPDLPRPKITLRVVGNWTTPGNFADRLASEATGYELSITDGGHDAALTHTATGQRFGLGLDAADDEIADLFDDGRRLSDAELAAVRRHTVKAFVTGPGGSVDAARAVLRAGAAVVRAGGLGVFVDNCGSTHSPADWLELAGDDGDGGVYWALVDLVGSPELAYSVGMHCLGYRDVELPNPGNPGRAMYLMHSLLGYSYRSGVAMNDGETLGAPDGPGHRLRAVKCRRFKRGTSFHNPYGVWRLEPVGG